VAVVGIGSYDFWGDCSFLFRGKWGCINKSGNEIVPIGKYKFVGSNNCQKQYFSIAFSDGMLGVCNWETEKWGFIDNTGNEVIPCKFDIVEWFPLGGKHKLFDPPKPFIDGFAHAMVNGKW
jgi:hypothetical protein